MRLASFGSGPFQKAAMFAVETKETNMRANPLNELFRLTRAELLALYAEIAAELASVPEMSTDREIALNNLRDIRRVLALKPRGPGPR
jgi:hypothetical protein